MRQDELLRRLKELAAQGRWCVSTAELGAGRQYAGNGLNVALARHVRAGTLLKRAAKALYLNPFLEPPDWKLEHLVALMRPDDAYYLSLESALHEHGWISQVPTVLTIMTTGFRGRRPHLHETAFGLVEFVHTSEPEDVWRPWTVEIPERAIRVALPELAFEDLQRLGRNLDLVRKPEE